MNLDLVTVVVDDYDPAIDFFVGTLGFELSEDSPSLTNDGRPERWVVVRPPGSATGVLLARADGEKQASIVGDQVAGRVGFFLRVDDFWSAYARMVDSGVRFVTEPRTEPYGRVAVFLDIAGNRWDLLGRPGRKGRTTMATEDDVRRLALDLPEVTERPCHGTPAFYAAGRIFARLHEQPDVLVLWRDSVEERQALLESDPEKFFTTDHYRGHASVLVRLGRVGAEELAELLDEAWRTRAPRRLTKD